MKVGIVFGAFDLLHAGHIHLFKQAKNECNYLIVGLHVDPSRERKDKNKPIESVFERMIRLKTNVYVDQVIVYETEKDLENILRYFQPDVRFIGSDYQGKGEEITMPEAVDMLEIESLPIHTSDIRKRIKNER